MHPNKNHVRFRNSDYKCMQDGLPRHTGLAMLLSPWTKTIYRKVQEQGLQVEYNDPNDCSMKEEGLNAHALVLGFHTGYRCHWRI